MEYTVILVTCNAEEGRYMEPSKSFRTNLEISGALNLRIGANLVAIGSCFVTETEPYLRAAGFHWQANPHGIAYNPLSVARGLEDGLVARKFEASDLVADDFGYFSFQFHGSFRRSSVVDCLAEMNDSLARFRMALLKADCLILTLGTAHVHWHKELAMAVNNCHKQSASLFERRLLTVEEIVTALGDQLLAFREANAHAPIVLTVSPIRHLRDGLVGNQRSKATLVLSAHSLCERVENCHYFPAYELLLDDLRDYRFYGEDLVHPNKTAVEFIVQRFREFSMTGGERQKLRPFDELAKRVRHRPLYGDATDPRFVDFSQETAQQLLKLKEAYPDADFSYFK